MSAQNTDKFVKVAPNTGWQLALGITDAIVDEIDLVSASGLPTDTAVILTIDRIDGSGAKTPSKMERIKGVISGDKVIDCIRGYEGTAQAHSAGAKVEIIICSKNINDAQEGILSEHNQDGSHKIVNLDEQSSSPATPASGKMALYSKNDGVLYCKNDAGEEIPLSSLDGWLPIKGTWSATDANTISIAGVDLTGILQKGDKIKLTNNSAVKYFYISTVPAFSTDTTFDVSGEVDLVAGAITLPYFSKIDNPQGFKKGENFYCARWVRGTNQTGIVDSVITKLTSTAVEFDGNSMISSSRITAPIKGRYIITAQLTAYSSTSKLAVSTLSIYKNGIAYKNVTSALQGYDGWYFPASYSAEINLEKGDYIELYVFNDTIDGSTSAASGELGLSFVGV